jgi:predicted protein tyrosine phosphatase
MPNRIFSDPVTKSEVWIGDQSDAINHAGHFDVVICVLEGCATDPKKVHPRAPMKTNHFAIVDYMADDPDPRRARIEELDRVAEFIYIHYLAGKRILVHCGAGIERSPFAVTWFLMKKKGMQWDAAFAVVQRMRPQAMPRDYWLIDATIPPELKALVPERVCVKRST